MRVRLSALCDILAVIILAGTVAPMGFAQDCRVSTILRVLDKRAQPVANVTAGQLKTEINGSRAAISSFSPTKPAVILMLDASASMRGTWNEATAAAKG